MLEANIVPVFVIVATDRSRDGFLLPYEVLRNELSSIGAQAIWFNKDNARDSQAIIDIIQTSYDVCGCVCVCVCVRGDDEYVISTTRM